MFPVLEKVQKGLPEFVTSHLSVTFLILEGDSFNVNQAGKTSLGTGDSTPQIRDTRYSASWWKRTLSLLGRQVPCGTTQPWLILNIALDSYP